jgi:outer membrane protein TolC
MIMRKLLILLVISGHASAATINLNENLLNQIASKGTPRLDEIESALLSATLGDNQAKERFAPELFGRGSYLETRERAIIRFMPIWSPVAQAQMGVRQNMANGLSATAAITTDQRNAQAPIGSFRNITTTTLSFTMQMDLWRDLFGRLSKAQLENAQLEQKRAEIEKDIQTKAFRVTLRRIYWGLVANQEALTISEELLKTAKRQAEETKLRFRNAVAEADEVARHEAQVASREGSILYLKYQRETYLKQLKNLLPELAASEISLDNYDLSKTMDNVLACTATIARESKVPYHYTRYDDTISLLRKIKVNAAQINQRMSDVDVQLFGTVQARGVGADELPSNIENVTNSRGSHGAAFNDMTTNNRTGYEVGLQFSMPLGDARENTKRTKELYDDKRLSAAINNTEAQIESTHYQLVKSIAILNDVIKAQRTNTEQLNKRLGIMRRKYEQARVSVNELIMDQDALFNSRLTTIDTQLQILNTLFDYLVIYTETPCEFNRI